jgi:hypothetical protein
MIVAGIMMHSYNPSTWEAEVSLGSIVRPCLKIKCDSKNEKFHKSSEG